ncbi:MAG TPA: bifunctional oligoribonuclease/PAP phosphatase NrnA [bacterium]|nr:bifunctional oligoribonuclease/PAP phosphatase NrnA [bacterium]
MKPAKKSPASKGSSPRSDATAKAAAIVRKGERFLVATHVNPDGDALGSALALAAGLHRSGKSVTVYNADPVPYYLKFLPGSGAVTSRLLPSDRFDAVFVVDCSELARVGKAFLSRLEDFGISVVLDHHARGKRDGDVRCVDAKAAASGVVVHRLLERLGVALTKQIAVNLYVTLATDTGWFRYGNTSAGVLRLAARLVEAGAEPDRISRALQESSPPARLKLLARVLDSLELYEGGTIGLVALTRAMLKETGGTIEMTDDFVEFPRSVASVEAAALLRETPDGWRVSLRSKEAIDVGAVATGLEGGGHIRAAGFTMKGDLATVRARTVAALADALRKSPVYKRKTAC